LLSSEIDGLDTKKIKFQIKGEKNAVDDVLKFHQEVLEYIQLFDEIYKDANFFFTVNHLAFIPLVLLRTLDLFGISLFLGALFELFLMSYAGQLISDKVKFLKNILFSSFLSFYSMKIWNNQSIIVTGLTSMDLQKRKF
jgi:hypothetical protein